VKAILDLLPGYRPHREAAIDATHALHSAPRLFVSLETRFGFGLPVDIDHSFERLADALITAFEIKAAHHISKERT
jgi:hypothetical protein